MKSNKLTKFQLIAVVIFRVLIGWYFLYEGLAKLLSPAWSSYAYLVDSQGLFSGLFIKLSQNEALMPIIDAVNIYGLLIIGLLLIVGLFEKYSIIGAMLFLILFYLSHPATIEANYILPPEGSYLWINKNIVMLGGLLVLLVFPTANKIGLARYLENKKNKR